MTNIESYRIINTINNQTCYVCEGVGSPLYQNLEDKVFDTPGEWSMLYCPKCKLSWLNPQPNPEEIHKIYKSYHTHNVSKLRWFLSLTNPIRVNILRKYYGYQEFDGLMENNLISKLLSNLPLLIEVVGMGILHLDASKKGKLLDVGCGTGQFLFSMQTLGWEVQGIEVDEQAASIAREEYKLNVSIGALREENFPEKAFDIITLSHVIEHVLDPIELLSECRRILKPSGKLILTTPNMESLGHRLFHENWRGLEVPRHMMVFSTRSIELCIHRAGFKLETIQSSERMARDIYNASRIIQYQSSFEETSGFYYSAKTLEGWFFQTFERIINSLLKNAGEEIYLIGVRDDCSY